MICSMRLDLVGERRELVSGLSVSWVFAPYCGVLYRCGACWGTGWSGMVEFLEGIGDVIRHGEIACAVMVVPGECNTTE